MSVEFNIQCYLFGLSECKHRALYAAVSVYKIQYLTLIPIKLFKDTGFCTEERWCTEDRCYCTSEPSHTDHLGVVLFNTFLRSWKVTVLCN